MTAPLSRLALALALCASASCAVAAEPPAPRAFQCSEPMLALLESASARELALRDQLPEELAEDLRGALSQLKAMEWAQASVPQALLVGQEARAFEARIKEVRAQHADTEALLGRAKAKARASGDAALLRETAAAERELAMARKGADIYASLAQGAKAFSHCSVPRGRRG